MSPEQTGTKTAPLASKAEEDLFKVLRSDIYSVQHFFFSNNLFSLCIVPTFPAVL